MTIYVHHVAFSHVRGELVSIAEPFALGLSVVAATELHNAMRESGPVHRTAGPDGHDVAVVTGYDDVASLLSDPRIVNVRPDGPKGSPGLPLPPMLARNLLNTDVADHRRLRSLAAPAFSRRHIHDVRDLVAAHVDLLLDELAEAGKDGDKVDLFSGLTSPLPARVIAQILGVEDETASKFRNAASDVMSVEVPAGQAGKAQDPRVPAMTQIVVILYEVIAQKRVTPDDGLISEWIAARDSSDKLSEEELLSLAFLVFLAGFENSVYQIANAIALLAPLDRPALLELLQNEHMWRERLTGLAFDAAPGSYATRRFATEDIEIGSAIIPRGLPIYLSLRAASMDPARGSRPELAFGRGPHFCPGSDLAMMQLDIVVRRLFTRFPDLEVLGTVAELPQRQTWRTHGPTSVPALLHGTPSDGRLR